MHEKAPAGEEAGRGLMRRWGLVGVPVAMTTAGAGYGGHGKEGTAMRRHLGEEPVTLGAHLVEVRALESGEWD